MIIMAEIKKLTKKEKFAMIKEYIADNDMLMEFIDNEINLLTKKASSTSKNKNQVENENLKARILELLTNSKNQYTITEFQNAFEEFAVSKYTNQKLSALFTQLVNEKKVIKIVDKKKSYFMVENA